MLKPYYLPSLLAPLVFPQGLREFNVAVLPLFGAASQQDHQLLTVAPEVNAGAWLEVQLVLNDASANAFGVREIAGLHARDGCAYLQYYVARCLLCSFSSMRLNMVSIR